MTFARPWMLLLLAVPALLALWESRRRGHEVWMPFDHGSARSSRWLRRVLLGAGTLPPMLLAVAVVFLAGPVRKGHPDQVREMTNIEFCLDVSGSMTSGFGEGSQYDAAMAEIEAFTGRRKGDAFGLTIFGNEVLRWVPLTKDLSAIRSATPFLRPEVLPYHFGGTEIGKALRFCMSTLCRQAEGDRLIILLSDGESADLDGNVPDELGRSLRDADIVVFAIHIGESPVPEALYAVVNPTGGRVYSVRDPQAMKRVFAHIDAMRPARLKPSSTHMVDDFGATALAGLVLLGLYVLTLFGLRYTPW